MNNYAIAMFLILLIIAGSGVGFYYVECEAVFAREQELNDSIEKEKQTQSNLKDIDSKIDEFRKELKKLEEEKSKLQTESIPLDTVVPKLLDSTETISNRFNVKFQDIRISPLVRAEDWSELPVEMTVSGTFNDIVCFLGVMEERKIVNLAAGSMNLSVSSEVDKNTKSPMLSVTLSAKVYILS